VRWDVVHGMIAWQADAPVDVQRPQAMGFPDPRARIMIVVPDYWPSNRSRRLMLLGGVRAAGPLLRWTRPVRFNRVAASDVDVCESVEAIPRRAGLNHLLADLAERQRDTLGAGLDPHHVTVGVQQTSAAAGAEELSADVIRADRAVAPDADTGNIPRLACGCVVHLRKNTRRDLCPNDR